MRAVIRFGLRAVQVCLEFSGSWIQWLFCLEILTLFLYLFSKLFVAPFVWLCFTIGFTILLSKDLDSDFFVLELTFCVESEYLVLHLGLLGFIWDSWAPFGTSVADRLTNAVRSTQTDRPTDRGDWQRASNGRTMNGQLEISCCCCCCCCCSR